MADLKYDFAESSEADCFPVHGWAPNSQAVPLLRLPVLYLGRQVNSVRAAADVESVQGFQQPVYALRQLTSKLATALSEVTRLSAIYAKYDFRDATDKERSEATKAASRLPLLTDVSFVYLRRLARQFVFATRPLLFQHPRSAPRNFKTLRDWIKDQSQLESAQPICDVKLLAKAFDRHDDWYERLTRRTDGEGQKGLRDAMEHRPVHTIVGGRGGLEREFKVEVNLHSPASDVPRAELLSELRTIIADLCGFWTLLHRAIGWGSEYHLEDCLVVMTGDFEEAVEYWPRIEDAC